MKQVTNITLGGIVFAMEQDAYDALSAYLGNIKSRLQVTDDYDEVNEDIETAIAEKFIARKKNEKIAVTVADVDAVSKEMGSPADFGDETGSDGASHLSAAAETSETKKRLYRDTDDAIIAGVASGLARYFDVDPVIVRLIFVISIFFNGLGILAYIILWLVVPAAETTAQKYAMRGEKVTLKEITERVKKNLNEVDTEKIKSRAENTWGGIRPLLVKLFVVLGVLIKAVVAFSRYIVGVAFVLVGALGIAGLVSVYIVVLLSQQVFFPADVQVALDVLTGSSLGIISMIASFIMMTIPLFFLVLGGVSLLAKENYFKIKRTVLLLVIWLVATMAAFTTVALQVEHVMQKVGPIEGKFNDSSFEIYWDEGVIRGDDNRVEFNFQKDETEESTFGTSIGKSIEIYEGIRVGSGTTVLDVSGKNLSGSLKAEIRHVENLRTLNVSDNNFTGLPAEIGQLSKLEELNLRNNQFTGLPHELGNLQNLKVLDLRGNSISEFDLQVIQERLPNATSIFTD